MNILLLFLIFAIIMVVASEIIHCLVFGWFIRKSKLDSYLNKYLPKYELNELDSRRRQFWSSGLPYIAISKSLLAKWHIEDSGNIPRWSSWSKKLDEYRAKLIQDRGGKSKRGIDKHIQ